MDVASRARRRINAFGRREGGASLVEFAILMPMLILLLLGIVEFGWGFAQQLDLRHKSREALRMLIVDSSAAEVQSRVCIDDVVRGSNITLLEIDSGVDPGDPITVTMEANVQQITGLFSAFWGPSPKITSNVEGRVEQETTQVPGPFPYQVTPPCP